MITLSLPGWFLIGLILALLIVLWTAPYLSLFQGIGRRVPAKPPPGQLEVLANELAEAKARLLPHDADGE